MRMVFNELSYKFPLKDVNMGKEIMLAFVKTYLKGVSKGLDDRMMIDREFNGTMLAEKYPIEKWRNDKLVDIEIRRVYKRLNDKAQFIDQDFIRTLSMDKECSCSEGVSNGFLVANELGFLAISFLCNSIWDCSVVKGKISVLVEDSIDELDADILHASKVSHIEEHIDWINKILAEAKLDVIDGQDLWNRKNELFPNLTFCESTKENVLKFRRGDLEFPQVLKKLSLLEKYFRTWDGKLFEISTSIPNVDPESRETLKRYELEHTFECPDGKKIIFSRHLRFTGGGYEGRIFFEPDFNEAKGIIGHIGRKLPTVSWSNP